MNDDERALYNRTYISSVKIVEELNKRFIRGLSLMEQPEKAICAEAIRAAFEDYFYVSGK